MSKNFERMISDTPAYKWCPSPWMNYVISRMQHLHHIRYVPFLSTYVHDMYLNGTGAFMASEMFLQEKEDDNDAVSVQSV